MRFFRVIACLNLLIAGFPGFGQILLSKDGMPLGDRQQFIAECIRTANDSLFNYNGLIVETDVYCTCVSDHLIPEMQSADFFKAVEENAMSDFLLREDNQKILIDCLFAHSDRLSKIQLLQQALQSLKDQSKAGCVESFREDKKMRNVFSTESLEAYCECSTEKIVAAQLESREIGDLNDEDGVAYHEFVLPCLSLLLERKTKRSLFPPNKPEDIVGGEDSCAVAFINFSAELMKMKLSIGGVTKYFLFDTGATDIMISQELEQELLASGALKREKYLHTSEIIAAGDNIVPTQLAIIDNVVIGDYTVNNVIISIVPGDPIVIGMSLLAKFSNWKLNMENEQIVLYK
jgi:hypothetical protein